MAVAAQGRLLGFYFHEVRPRLDLSVVWRNLAQKNGRMQGEPCRACSRRETYIYQDSEFLICGHSNSCGARETILERLSGKERPDGADLEAAVKHAAELAQVRWPGFEVTPEERRSARDWMARQRILEFVVQWASGQLQKAERPLEYLSGRGISAEDALSFKLGWIPSPIELSEYAQSVKLNMQDLTATGLTKWNLHGYILFPWRDEYGNMLTIAGRWGSAGDPPLAADHKANWGERERIPKMYYLPGVTPHSPLYLDLARKARVKELVTVEGLLDGTVAQLRGDKRVVVTGTDSVTGPQAETIGRINRRNGSKSSGFDRIILCPDSDKVGQDHIQQSIERLYEHRQVVVVAPPLPDKLDPDEFILKNGIEAWKEHTAKATPALIHAVQKQVDDVTPESDEDSKLRHLDKAISTILAFSSESPTEEAEAVSRISKQTGYSKSIVKAELGKKKKKKKADAKASRSPQGAPPGTYQPTGQPRFFAKDEEIARVVPQVWAAMASQAKKLGEPIIYRRLDEIHEVAHGDSGRPYAKKVSKDRLKSVLAEHLDFYTMDRSRVERAAVPPDHIVAAMDSDPEPPLPLLERIVTAPVFAPDGEIQTEPGYHEQSRTIFYAEPGFQIPRVPLYPLQININEAISMFNDDLVTDFPFETKSDRANAMALFLLGFCRSMIRDKTPMHLFTSPSQGTGKSLLVNSLLIPALGTVPAIMSYIQDEEELRKSLASCILAADEAVIIDNIRGTLQSPTLEAALTAWPDWGTRMMATLTRVRVPVRCMWAATGNNVQLGRDMVRRVVPIRIDAHVERPFERDGFKHELPTWAHQNRPKLVWAALVIIRHWVNEGMPMGTKIFGGFEDYSKIMGGILGNAGVDGFLNNLNAMYETSDDSTDSMHALVMEWWRTRGTEETKVSFLHELVKKPDLNIQMDLGRGSEMGQRTKLGHLISQVRDRVFDGIAVRKAGITHKVAMWRLEKLDTKAIELSKMPIKLDAELSADIEREAGEEG